MKNTSAPAITVDLTRKTERFTKIEETLPLLRELAGGVRSSRKAFRDARLELGAALVQIREQAPFGAWESFLDSLAERLDLNRHSLFNALAVAEKLCGPKGRLSREKVSAAAANLHARADLATKPMASLTLIDCEVLAGRRTPPRRSVEEIHAEMEAELEGGRGGTGAQRQSGKGDDAMGEFASIGSGMYGRMGVSAPRVVPPVTLLRQERGRVDARHEQLMLDGVYAEARTLIENVSAMKLGVEKRSKVDELTRDYMAAVRKLVAIDVVA